MPDRLIERTLRTFSDELSADTPVPGGGSAAAYAGAMGAALAAMVARIAAKKESSEPMRAFAEEMDGLRADFLRFVDEDSEAYGRVAAAMKLPRKTEEEKAARQEVMQGALLGASRVPRAVAGAERRAPCTGHRATTCRRFRGRRPRGEHLRAASRRSREPSWNRGR